MSPEIGEIIGILIGFGIFTAGIALLIFLGIVAGRLAFIVSDHMADWFDDVCDIFGNWLERKARKKEKKNE